jgi:tetratricopeptide (TPR) repeat protein
MIRAEVRSEVAERCSRIYAERAQSDQSLRMLNTALQLNPVNLKALMSKYAMTEATALPIDRVMQLLAILQANPADPVVGSRLAEQLAQLGLVRQSVTWYSYANGIYAQTALHPDTAFALGAASELFIANHTKEAGNLIAAYIKAFPDDVDGRFLQLAITKYAVGLDPKDGDAQSANATALRETAIALTDRLQEIRAAAGDATATTRPIDSPTEGTLPDLSDDVSRLKSAGKADLTASYVQAAASLTWFDLY